MSLVQMSFSGAVMIIAILLVRMVAINKLPKIVFVVLWEIAFLRLLIPISIPSVFSAYSMIRENHITQEAFTEGSVSYLIPEAQEVQFAAPALIPETQEIQSAIPALIPEAQEVQSVVPAASIPLWMILWIAGMIICALFFLITYLRCYREFRMSLPVSNAFTEKWLKEHQIKRDIKIRQSDRISSPLTYGIFRPVILMPKTTDWEDLQRLQYILQHEYVHIRRFDMIRKLVAALVLCIHWFNPAVWLMYLVYNRDIELSCDERVIREFGESSKPLYAKALIAMEEKRNSLQPLSNSFSKNAIEERIKAVMKTKKVTVWASIISIAVIVIIILVFATSANIAGRDEQVSANTTGEDTTLSSGSVNNTINNYEGEWHRTDVGSYQSAEFIISDWKEGESFEVSGGANYGYYGGPIEGTAIFIEDDLAVLYDENVEDFLKNQEGDHGIYFQFLEDSIIVTHDSYVRMWFGGGGIATAEGTYIQGEPEYTNCDDVSEIFSDGELKQIQELLGEGYNDLFKNIIETGEMTEYEIDNGRLWEAYRPPYGAEWCNIIIYDDGRIYIEGQAYTGPTQFYTNSEDTEMPNAETVYHREETSYPLEQTIQNEIMNGDFSAMEDSEFKEYIEEIYQRWEEHGTIEEMEWRLIDLNGDGIDDLILQEAQRVGQTQMHRIVAIFAIEEDNVNCMLWDLNDSTEYSFCGSTGELMYTAPYSGTAIAGEPYRHYYYDSEWNKINDYWLDRTIVDSSMDGSREEFLQYNHGFIEAHPDMAEDGEYYSRYEIDIETGELKEREALSYEQFKEIFEDVMGMEYENYYP